MLNEETRLTDLKQRQDEALKKMTPEFRDRIADILADGIARSIVAKSIKAVNIRMSGESEAPVEQG